MSRGVASHQRRVPVDLLDRAKREILGALCTAGPHGSLGADLREAVVSATITDKVYRRARYMLGEKGLVTMAGQRTSLTEAGRAHAAARAA